MSAISRRRSVLLWTLQLLLTALFLFAGIAKLTMPPSALAAIGLGAGFLRFIAVAEIAGALGLVLPGALRTARYLTPLAACGLVIIMIGAVTVSAAKMGAGAAVPPAIVGIVAALVAYGRGEDLSSVTSRSSLVAGR